jgi:hypothetical protein
MDGSECGDHAWKHGEEDSDCDRAEDEHDENDPGGDVQHTDVVTLPELDLDPETRRRNL